MIISLIQFNPKTADIEENIEKIKNIIKDDKTSDLMIFPSLSITGINCRDYFLSPEFIEKQNTALKDIRDIYRDKDIIIGFVEKIDKKLYSSVALLSEGLMKILCRKKDLTLEESKYFAQGEGASDFEYRGRLMTVSLDKIKDCKTDILINLSLENYQADTILKRQKNNSFQEIRVNPVCLTGSYLYDGRSFVSNKKGEKIILAPAFEETIVTYDDNKVYEKVAEPIINVYDETINGLVFALKDFCKKIGFKKII